MVKIVSFVISPARCGENRPGKPEPLITETPSRSAAAKSKPKGADASSIAVQSMGRCASSRLVKMGLGMVLKIKSKEVSAESCSKKRA